MHLPSMPACFGLRMIPAIFPLKISGSQKPEIPTFATISGKRLTASGNTFLNTRNTMPENMLRRQDISIREHSRLHLVNSYDSFLDCWPKTNCTPAKNWTPNIISERTDFRFSKCRCRGFINVTLFLEIPPKTFFKKSLTYYQNAFYRFL